MIILKLIDFQGGKYAIPDAGSVYAVGGSGPVNNVQAAIDKYEKKAIYALLGVVEGDKFITWIQSAPPPTNADYSKILDAFSDDNTDGCGSIVQSLGMKEYLMAYVWYEYEKNKLTPSQPGLTQPQAETSTIQSVASTNRNAEKMFNGVLDTVEAIQWYCLTHETAFPDFNGQRIVVKYANFI